MPFSGSLLICLPSPSSLPQWTCAPVHHERPQTNIFLPWDLSPQEEASCQVRRGGCMGRDRTFTRALSCVSGPLGASSRSLVSRASIGFPD